ncbi:MAG: chemotaxis protein CheW, partial [Leptospiraceae bacterium]|nr:chemotaxis protein CheW [Leptospiraceae bacterium]
LIHIADDGRGLNTEKILERAIERGLVSPERAQSLTAKEIHEFIFTPGFSTRDVADEISGRGYGMDIVRDAIRQLSGELELETTPGQGTRITLRLPLTLLSLSALVVGLRNDHFALPLNSIEEVLKLPAGAIAQLEGSEVVRWRDRLIPFVRLDAFLGYPPLEESRDYQYALIATTRRRHVALGVDALLGKKELVIKSLAESYRPIPGLSGVSLLGDGSIVFVVDAEAIAANLAAEKQEMAAHKKPDAESHQVATREKSPPKEAAATLAVEQPAASEPKALLDFSKKDLVRQWIAQSNHTAIENIRILTSNETIALRKSRGTQIKPEKIQQIAKKIKDRAANLLLIHLPMQPRAGGIDLILEKRAAQKMVRLLFQAAGLDPAAEFDPGPLLEVTNILGSAYTNTLTFLTGKKVEPATPELYSTTKAIHTLLARRLESPATEFLVVENQFVIADEGIAVELLIYLNG